MTQYNTLNAKLFNSQLNKLKSIINLSSNKIGDSNDKTNFAHKLLLTDTQVLMFREAFANGSSTNIHIFKNCQLSRMVELGGELIESMFGSYSFIYIQVDG